MRLRTAKNGRLCRTFSPVQAEFVYKKCLSVHYHCHDTAIEIEDKCRISILNDLPSIPEKNFDRPHMCPV